MNDEVWEKVKARIDEEHTDEEWADIRSKLESYGPHWMLVEPGQVIRPERPSATMVRMHLGNKPPEAPTTRTLWMDTTLEGNWVLRYHDSDEWVRMDGGGDIPSGFIEDRHIADQAISMSKVAGLEVMLKEIANAFKKQLDEVNTRLDALKDPQ